jgi:hypothetical protein
VSNINEKNAWDIPTMLLWSVFFAVGLVPEFVFHLLRRSAAVSSSTALVNSSAIITLAFTFFVVWFVYRNGLEPYSNKADSRGKATQIGLLALLAFMDIPTRSGVFEVHTLLEIMIRLNDLSDWYLRFVVMLVALSKLTAWCFLYSLFFRYHLLGNRMAFMSIPSLFPSTRKNNDDDDSGPEMKPVDTDSSQKPES